MVRCAKVLLSGDLAGDGVGKASQPRCEPRELDPDAEVTVVLADAYPNFSVCRLPYAISGEVAR